MASYFITFVYKKSTGSINYCVDRYATCILESYPEKNFVLEIAWNSKAGFANGPFLETTILTEKYS